MLKSNKKNNNNLVYILIMEAANYRYKWTCSGVLNLGALKEVFITVNVQFHLTSFVRNM